MASHTTALEKGGRDQRRTGLPRLSVASSRADGMLRYAISRLTLRVGKSARRVELRQNMLPMLVNESYMTTFGSSTVDPRLATFCSRGAPCPGLKDDECFALAAFLRSIPGNWFMQWNEDEFGRPLVVIFSRDNDDKPVLAISRDDLLCKVELETATQAFDLGKYGEFNAVVQLVATALGGSSEILLGSERYWAALADCAFKAGCRQEAEQLIAYCLSGQENGP